MCTLAVDEAEEVLVLGLGPRSSLVGRHSDLVVVVDYCQRWSVGGKLEHASSPSYLSVLE